MRRRRGALAPQVRDATTADVLCEWPRPMVLAWGLRHGVLAFAVTTSEAVTRHNAPAAAAAKVVASGAGGGGGGGGAGADAESLLFSRFEVRAGVE